MSMSTLTTLHIVEVFLVYTLVTVVLPAILFHKRLAGRRTLERIMIYMTIGNFYVMNEVFLLELLHISNRITLILFTVIPATIFVVYEYGEWIAEYGLNKLEMLQKVLIGVMGWRTFLAMIRANAWKELKKASKKFWFEAKKSAFDWAAFIIVFAALVWMYGTSATINYSYAFSDVPVHNYWINALGDNNIFVAGVYPHGFHCMIYYLHTVFGIDTFVILRVFGLTQTLYIHFMLFAFVRCVCNSKFSVYIGIIVYALFNVVNGDATSRFMGPLPQEYGMLFILPSIYFAWRFLAKRKIEIKNEKLEKEAQNAPKKKKFKDSSWYLVWFAANFGMTLSAHFYDTMIAGLFCVALAMAFIYRVLNYKYLGRIVLAVIASLFVSILPMGIAVAMGKPLEGSLRWGLSILNASNSGLTKNAIEEYVAVGDYETDNVAKTYMASIGENQSKEQTSTENLTKEGASVSNAATIPAVRTGTKKTVRRNHSTLYNGISNTLLVYVLKGMPSEFFSYILGGFAVMVVFGLLACVMKHPEYGCMLIAIVIFNFLMLALLASNWLGIPALMEPNRAAIYEAYTLAMTVGVLFDCLPTLVLAITRNKFISNMLSLVFLIAVVVIGHKNALFRTSPRNAGRFETNGAITCLTNIMHSQKDNTWTIVSANDELRMIDGHGFHFEPITFLQMLRDGKDIRIDTPDVYFYVEKIPLDYASPYANSGQSVSKEGAARPLPVGTGLTVYKGEKRWIVMSKMQQWAQRFSNMYPYEMQVYYEDDDFVCYHLQQNMYSLYNLNIDK